MNTQEKLGMELQKSLHEARMNHTNIHALYYKYKSSYDSIVRLTPKEVDYIYKYDLLETINRLTKRFWNSIELLTNIFFSVSNLLLLKENTEKDLENSCKLPVLIKKEQVNKLLKVNQSDPLLESNTKSRALDINANLEWQIKAYSGSIAYAKCNMMKFKFATHHAPEFMNRIRIILRWPHAKWNTYKLKGLQKNLKHFRKQELILLEELEKLNKKQSYYDTSNNDCFDIVYTTGLTGFRQQQRIRAKCNIFLFLSCFQSDF